jgi:hypothetical protein
MPQDEESGLVADSAHRARREAQQRAFRRNQGLGLLLIAAALLAYRLTQTPSGWIFPSGWWRLW